jgi:DNA-binding CsgD family transcriptional regulator
MNKATAVSTFRELGLTRREADVLLWIVRGQSNAEIGASLRISPRTVKKHLEHIFSKLGVKSRLAAAVRAGRHVPQDRRFLPRRRRADSGKVASPVRNRVPPFQRFAHLEIR